MSGSRQVQGLYAAIFVIGTLAPGFAVAKTIKVPKPAPEIALAEAVPAPLPASPSPVIADAIVAKATDVPVCARKVKIVYAGYGEAERATCGGVVVATP